MAGKLKLQDGPHLVFLDTSAIEVENFAFGGKVLSELMQWCKDDVITLVLTEVTIGEVKRRIKKSAATAKKAMEGIKKESRLLGRDRDLWSKLRNVSYYSDLADEAISEFDEFIKESQAIILGTDSVKASNVFLKYFAIEPPFSTAKEKEFADGFALEALIQYADTQKRTIHVVSDDGDFAAACEKRENLVVANRVAEVVEHAIGWSLSARSEVILKCHELVDENTKEIFEQIEARLRDVRFDLDAPAGRVLSLEIQDTELVNQHVIELDELHAVISAPTNVSIKFAVEYYRIGDSYYDREDRLVFPEEFVTEDIEADIDLNVEIVVSIEMPYPKDLREVKVAFPDEFMLVPEKTSYTAII